MEEAVGRGCYLVPVRSLEDTRASLRACRRLSSPEAARNTT
jgi:hypothetical protein